VLRVTLNRPGRRNALSQAVVAGLDRVFERIAADKTVRVVVIAAAGPVFCAGHDLAEMTGRTEAEYRALFSACAQMMQRLRGLPQPVIARVQGMATAAGCQLVASCDLAVASTEALFATPGVKIGLFCTTPMVPLVRAVSAKRALEMLLTGAPISAEQALEAGLVNRVVPAQRLDETIDELCRAICAASPAVVQLGKAAFYDQLALDEPAAYERSVEIITGNALRHDAQEGISAFLEKRKPEWTGE
jgi:enoyl-CoA hydratase/carnithine racemase